MITPGVPGLGLRADTLAVASMSCERSGPEMQEAEELQANRLGQFFVALVRDKPKPPPGCVRGKVVAASSCASEVRFFKGDKAFAAGIRGPGTPGHEGVMRIEAIGPGVDGSWLGKDATILPHLFPPGHDETCPYLPREPRGPWCCGLGCTAHIGFLSEDSRGTYTQYLVLPVENVVTIPPTLVEAVSAYAGDLPPEALFSLGEPFLCSVSALALAQSEHILRFKEALVLSRALVVGAGPMGAFNALVVSTKGCRVWLHDEVTRRAWLAADRLDDARISVWDQRAKDFDLVLVTAPKRAAVEQACDVVRDHGTVILFSGLNYQDRQELKQLEDFPYDRIHRKAEYYELPYKGKVIRVIGSSGYFERLAVPAIQLLAEEAPVVFRMVTGVIEGLSSSVIRARVPGASDVHTADGCPALVAILKGEISLMNHLKVVVLP